MKVILKRGMVTLREVFADEHGRFHFNELTEGDYDVIIESEGYQRFEHRSAMRYRLHEEDRITARLVPTEAQAAATISPGGLPAVSSNVPRKALRSFEKGQASNQQGKHKEAVRHFRRAVEIAPEFSEAWNRLGNNYRILSDLELSEQALLRALELAPEAAQTHLDLGMLRLAQGDTPAAESRLRSATEIDPRLAPPHFLLGVIAYQNGDSDAAAAKFQQALELDPAAAPEASVYLASIRARQGRLAEAVVLLDEFLAGYPGHAQAAQAGKLLEQIEQIQSAQSTSN